MPAMKSFVELGKAVGMIPSNELAEQLINFLVFYRQENPGCTPSIQTLASHLNVREESIRQALNYLENARRIHISSRHPFHIIIVEPGIDLFHGEEPAPDPARYDTFLEMEAKRHELGRFIGEVEKNRGRGPTLREMMDFTGISKAGPVARMAEILAKRGLVQYGHGLPTKLTEKGRQYYATKGVKEMDTQTEVMERPSSGATERTRRKYSKVKGNLRKSPCYRVDALCKALAKYKTQHGELATPSFSELTTPIGVAVKSISVVRKAAEAAAQKGYLQKFGKFHGKHGAQFLFTEKGRNKYMPEASEQPAPRRRWVGYRVAETDQPATEESVMTFSAEANANVLIQIGDGEVMSFNVPDADTFRLAVKLAKEGYEIEKA